MMNRLRNDFDLAIVTLFSILAILGVAPFAVYRYFTGNTLAALLDAFIVLSICFGLLYVWRGGNAKRASLALILIGNLGCIASAAILGLAGLFWAFPVIVVNFFMLSRRMALLISILTLCVLVIHGKAFDSTLELIVFSVTATVVGLQSLIFASRTEIQRKLLEELSLSDPLTGAQNRRAMNQELDVAIKCYQPESMPYGLLIMDLDHFKAINDKYGHEEGDDVLVRFSELIKKHSRKTDRFFRMGGEEFMLLLPGANHESLQSIAEHHRECIEQNLRCHGKTITVSIGAAALRDNENQQNWVARADAALYKAKESGRNCAVNAS